VATPFGTQSPKADPLRSPSRSGRSFGPYADDSTFALALHAQQEVAHHGAEIALLRDLYAAQR
jgi:hypothetical protein